MFLSEVSMLCGACISTLTMYWVSARPPSLDGSCRRATVAWYALTALSTCMLMASG